MSVESVEAKRSAGVDAGLVAEESVAVTTSLTVQKSVGANGSVTSQGNLGLNGTVLVNGSTGAESLAVEGSVVPKPLSLWEQICLEYELEQPSPPEALKIDKQDETSAFLESSIKTYFSPDQSQLAQADFTCMIGQPPAQRLSIISPSKTYFELEQTSSTEGSKIGRQFGTPQASLDSSLGLNLRLEQSRMAPTDFTSLTEQPVAEPLSALPAAKTCFKLEQPLSSVGLKTDLQFRTSASLQLSAYSHFRQEQSQLGLTGSTMVPPAGSTMVPPAGSTSVIDKPLPVVHDPKTCHTREYLETFIFPILLPGMDEMLREAYRQKCFERKRTKFIALDFLTQWLYNFNQKRKDQQYTDFFQIPFVADWLKDHPRHSVPLSLLLNEEEAALIIQSFWRGYRARCDPEVQELRQWQKQLREKKNIHKKVEEFWLKQEFKVGMEMGVAEEEHIPNHSGVSIHVLSPTPQNTVILS